MAIIITLEQIDTFFGFELHELHNFLKLKYIVEHIGSTNVITLGVGVASVLFLFGMGFLKDRTKTKPAFRWLTYVPEILLVVVLGITITAIASLQHKGLAVLGRFEGALPTPRIPKLSFRSSDH